MPMGAIFRAVESKDLLLLAPNGSRERSLVGEDSVSGMKTNQLSSDFHQRVKVRTLPDWCGNSFAGRSTEGPFATPPETTICRNGRKGRGSDETENNWEPVS
jgi:hypothetical protein